MIEPYPSPSALTVRLIRQAILHLKLVKTAWGAKRGAYGPEYPYNYFRNSESFTNPTLNLLTPLPISF